MTSSELSDADIAQLENLEIEATVLLFRGACAVVRKSVGIEHLRHETGAYFACRQIAAPPINRILGLGIGKPMDDKHLDRAIQWAETHCAGTPLIQIAPSAQSAMLEDRLKARGFWPTTIWAKLWRRTANAPPRAAAETSLVVRQAHQADAAHFGDILAAGFGLPAALAPWFAALVGAEGYWAYLAYDGNRPVAAGGMFVSGGWGWLGPAATLPAFRSHGAQCALLARAIADGKAMHLEGLTAESGMPAPADEDRHPSFRNLLRAGFDVAYQRPNYQRPRGLHW